MATHCPAFGRPITANILSQGETAQPGNTPATLGNTPATLGKPIATSGNPPATPGEALADFGEALANHKNPLAAFGMGLGQAFPLLGIHLTP